MLYRFTTTWQQVDDIEADSAHDAELMMRGYGLDTTKVERVDVELVGEVDVNGDSHPVGQVRLVVVR